MYSTPPGGRTEAAPRMSARVADQRTMWIMLMFTMASA